ncbi:MAG: hypothetical protein H7281_02630 [Bacteriovorax sp.]|nr:hypothetical protein [Bacteriovorax sp.]
MNKLQSTVHFISNLQEIRINNFFIKLAFLGPVFFLCFQNNSFALTSLNIAIIDTGFCPDKIKIENIKIDNVIDLTESVKLDCSSSKFNIHSPRFHGQLVLEEFLKFFDHKKKSIHFYPLIVFNERGDQKSEYWIKAIEWIKKNKIDVVVTASGFITNDKLVSELPAIWFVPSGRVTPQIKKESGLFPQNLAPKENLFIIGDFYAGRQVLYDSGLLFQDKIDYFFPSGEKGFEGTSRAVAEGSARALNLCPLITMRECLKKHGVLYNDNLSRRKIQTF